MRSIQRAGLWVWQFVASATRLFIALLPLSQRQAEAIRLLRDELDHLPAPLQNATSEARSLWLNEQTRVRYLASHRDPRAFLTWAVIRETMSVPPFARFVAVELKFLRSQNWSVWRTAIKERLAGCPSPCLFFPRSSSTAIHHGYHLCRFEISTGLKIASFGLILEFGGGYGSLCRIVHNLGFSGRYLIFDLPEQCALQRYYLDSVEIHDVVWVSDLNAPPRTLAESQAQGPRLFIATWSLSESPYELRKKLAEVIASFDAFLIAYMDRFLDLDNSAFFSEWKNWFPGVLWTTSPIAQLPGSTYLFGVRPSLSQ